MKLDPFSAFFIGWAGAALFMLFLWGIQVRTRNAGIVDIGWTMILGGLSVFYAVVSEGFFFRRLLVASLGGVWSLRLTFYLVRRLRGQPEEGRYVTLRKSWGPEAHRNFFFFYQAQAAAAALLSVAFLVPAYNRAEAIFTSEVFAILLWVVAARGESLADRQLEEFRSNPANRGKTCRQGLWRYSRHPNYFFEWLHWVSYGFLGYTAPYGWIAALPALMMLFFIVKVTGIPPTEAQALKSRGDDYRRYQETTSAFIPWFPKE